MKTKLSLFVLVAALTAAALSGCGGGGTNGDDTTSPSTSTGGGTTNTPQGDLAPASVAGKTFNGRIGTTTTTWQIVFTGNSYNYSENGRQLDSGNYTWTKTSPTTAVLTLADGTTLELTYGGNKSGSYLISKSSETGTFTNT